MKSYLKVSLTRQPHRNTGTQCFPRIYGLVCSVRPSVHFLQANEHEIRGLEYNNSWMQLSPVGGQNEFMCVCVCTCSGYTVTSVVSAKNGRLLVAGAPRFNHTGKVIIFTLKNSGNLTILHSLKGQQVETGTFRKLESDFAPTHLCQS